jgi:hypothetical protein
MAAANGRAAGCGKAAGRAYGLWLPPMGMAASMK